MKKRLVIVGLGLIGGSLAKALRGFEDYEIIGVDVSQPTLRYAMEQDIVGRGGPSPGAGGGRPGIFMPPSPGHRRIYDRAPEPFQAWLHGDRCVRGKGGHFEGGRGTA